MDYRKFKMELLELVQKHMDEHVEISFERIPKNNGIFLEGMVFHQKERSVSPVIYMEEFYERLRNPEKYGPSQEEKDTCDTMVKTMLETYYTEANRAELKRRIKQKEI